MNSIDTTDWLIKEIKTHFSDPDDDDYNTKKHEDWKQRLNALAPEKRKSVLLESVKVLRSDDTLPDKLLTICLRTLQDLVLSPRVTNLNSLNFYIRRTDGYYHRPPTLNLIKFLFKHENPKEPIYFVTNLKDFPEKKLLESRKINWVVLKYGRNLHCSLMRISFENDKGHLEIFDSLGVSPNDETDYRKPYRSWMQNIVKFLSSEGQSLNLDTIKCKRQRDAVNCVSFVFEDFRVAQSLSKKGNPSFSQGKAHSDFFKISQAPESVKAGHIEASLIRASSYSTKTSTRNVKATLISLKHLEKLLDIRVKYPDASYVPDVNSENDEEDGCVIC